MKYYLETNAIRALGSQIMNNDDLRANSFTSLFSLFELTKGIGRATDSHKRKNILEGLAISDLKLINKLPIEMIQSAYCEAVDISGSEETIKAVGIILSGDEKPEALEGFQKIIRAYEDSTKKFQRRMTEEHAIPAPEPKLIRLDLESMFSDQKSSGSQMFINIPKDSHPSTYFIEYFKKEDAVSTYRAIFGNDGVSDEEILGMYNGCLDMYFFARRAFNLKKHCLREASAKNDWLDILHATYLTNQDIILISNDKIFDSILPGKNIISVEEYRKLI